MLIVEVRMNLGPCAHEPDFCAHEPDFCAHEPDCCAHESDSVCRILGRNAVPRTPGPAPKLDAKDREIAALNSKLKRLERVLAIVNGLVELQKWMQAMASAMQRDDLA